MRPVKEWSNSVWSGTLRTEHEMMKHVPKSQNAVHTLGSAPLNSCLSLSRNIAQEEAGEPGSGRGIRIADDLSQRVLVWLFHVGKWISLQIVERSPFVRDSHRKVNDSEKQGEVASRQ